LKKYPVILFFLAAFFTSPLVAQPPQFSMGTDIDLLRSFKEDQQFWAFGHTLHANFHITEKDGVYFWLSYYTNGKFTNDLTATAKSPLTNPQEIDYSNKASMGFRHFSIGWKKYLIGAYNIEAGWNLYAYAGFGMLAGRVENTQEVTIDTSLYKLPVLPGIGKFKRLTLDLGLGWEIPLGGEIFLYTEGRLWVPTTDYPSKYVFVNTNAPLVGMLCSGIRIVF
jgi:hypothetical protein